MSRVHSLRDLDRGPNKRPKTFDGAHHEEEMSRKFEGPSTREAYTIRESLTSQVKLRKVSERLDRLYKSRMEIVVKSCKLGFSIGFERCKEMPRVHLQMGDAESL